MIDGITAIKNEEAHQKRLKHLNRSKHGCFVTQIMGNYCNIHEFCDEDKCEYITEINDLILKNRRVPQIVDTDIYKHF